MRGSFRYSTFSKQQRKVFTWWLPNSPVCHMEGIIADGAIRSGKTLSMALSYVIWAMACFTDQNFAMCGKTLESFRRNVLISLIPALIGRGYNVTEHRSEHYLAIGWGRVVNRFYLFGGKDESSQDFIQGITLAGVFFDEVALMPESFVNQATGRCSVEGSKFWFNCNPSGPYHYFKTKWIDERLSKGLLYLHFTMEDNLSLSNHVRQRYRNMYSGVFYDRYILGLWKAAEGVIYTAFDESKQVLKDVSKYNTEYYIAIDYGTQNPTVFLLFARQKRDIEKWCLIKEYYYSGREKKIQKTDPEYADDLKNFIGNYNIEAVVVDPSAASFIALLRQRSFKVVKAKNDVQDGIRFVAGLLAKGNLYFNENCHHTILEFHSYVWDEGAAESGRDAPVKQFDHTMDALRYFAYTIIRHRHSTSNKSR